MYKRELDNAMDAEGVKVSLKQEWGVDRYS
jgi:hypothetical protein